MDQDRTVRRLTTMTQRASTARVLNLAALHQRLPGSPELAAAPMFQNRRLDRSIIIKHRLRPHEYGDFYKPQRTATKLMVPIDAADLRIGARYAFVGQRDFDHVMAQTFGEDLLPGSRDRKVLDALDELPSLDPFLMREHLRRQEIEPDPAYFGVSAGDMARMHDFVRQEVTALVAMSSGQNQNTHAYASRLVEKLLSSAPEEGFEPLKATLKLSDQEYQDGVFAWRGFLYYKWKLVDLQGPAVATAGEIMDTLVKGPKDVAATAYLSVARGRLGQSMVEMLREMRDLIAVYNKAYAALTRDGQPMAFRDFLIKAPGMFNSLGEHSGALEHIVSFWRYRFPVGWPRVIPPTEMMDMLMDFEEGVTVTPAAEDENALVL